MSDHVSRRTAITRIKRRIFDDVLMPGGFARIGTNSWVRDLGEIHHAFRLDHGHGRFTIHWGVVCADATRFMHDDGDVADPQGVKAHYGVLTGTPAWPDRDLSGESFKLGDDVSPWVVDRWIRVEQIEEIVAASAPAVARTEVALRRFQTRQDVRSYLLESRADRDPRHFFQPNSLALKLKVAAGLAILDGDPAAESLVAEATELRKLGGWGADVRIDRLHDALKEMRP